jgi:hypothetical protein
MKKRKRNRAFGAKRASKRTVKKVEKRVSAALTRFLKKQNPAFKKAIGVGIQKLKGGVLKLTPIQRNPGRREARVIRGGANYWIVKRRAFIKGQGWYEEPDIVKGSKTAAQESARAYKSGN